MDVKSAQQDGTTELEDDQLLDRATALNRALFTRDDDLLAEAKKRQQAGRFFAGIIYAHQLRVTIGKCISDLELSQRPVSLKTSTIEWNIYHYDNHM